MESYNNAGNHCEQNSTKHVLGSTVIVEDDVFITMDRGKLHRKKNDGMFMMVLSAMYSKLMFVMGIAFPLSPIVSPHTPAVGYEAFYIYLYGVSIIFLIYAFTVHSSSIRDIGQIFTIFRCCPKRQNNNDDAEDNNSDKVDMGYAVDSRNYGSFYLRVGAVVFGIGSMIYSGLEFIQFMEIKTECWNIVQVLTPCFQLMFTFMQLYFIFINSRMTFHRHQAIGHMGLMHLMATNLSVWLHSVIAEAEHEILHRHGHYDQMSELGNHGRNFTFDNMLVADDDCVFPPESEEETHERVKRSAPMMLPPICRESQIFSELIQDLSPFLFPCKIEYSLICAAICYIMWKHAGQKRIRHPSDSILDLPYRKHQYNVDCSHATKGLFTGILILVLSIISVILFFVLVNKKENQNLAVQLAYVSELVLFVLTTLAVIVAMVTTRRFRRARHRKNVELDSILLIMGQIGIYFFSVFSIVAAHLSKAVELVNTFIIVSSIGRLLQATLQTMFIIDAAQRTACTVEQTQKKPGREMVTFLLVCNFAMWVNTTLETGRHYSHVIQIGYFGFWGWTTIARLSTPLAIFYRFHSTVCLCEIWKKLYKMKTDQL